MSTQAERFHRTIPERPVNDHEDLLALRAWPNSTSRMANGLADYNAVLLPHHGLGLRSPLPCLIQYQKKSQRGWTNHCLDFAR